MNLNPDEFEKKLHQFLTGQMSDDQICALEEVAKGDVRAAWKLDQVKNLHRALHDSAREHRRTSYPGNLAAEIMSRTPVRLPLTIRRRRWAYALAATLLVISSLVIFRHNRPVENSASVVPPSLTVMADIQKGLSEFKLSHNRQLAGWSRSVTLTAPNPGEIKNIGLQIPARPTIGRHSDTIKNRAEGAKL